MTKRRRTSLRRFSYRRRRTSLIVIVLAVAVAVISGRWPSGWLPSRDPPPSSLEPGVYRVQRVVDGDTLVLANGAKVRLIGSDTPEIRPEEPWGPEATRFTEDFVSGGEIRLQLDGRRKGPYGRFLAHVWVGDRSLSEELIRAGLATAETRYSYSQAMKDRFCRAEDEALAARRGIWSPQPPP